MARPRKKKEDTQAPTNKHIGSDVGEFFKEQEIIPTVDVGAEVVEQALVDNPELSQEFIEDALKATQEIEEGDVTPYTGSSEALQEEKPLGDTEVSDPEENASDSVTEPPESIFVENSKQILFNGQGNPVPTTKLTLKHVYMQEMVADILQVAYLGGDLDPTFHPRFTAVPFLCKMLIPTDMMAVYENKTQKAEYHEDGEVVLIKAFDVVTLIKQLISVGKKGYVLTPKKAVITNGKFLVYVTGRVPIKPSINFNVDVRTLAKYTREELTSFDMDTLKGLGERYGVSHRAKVPLIASILKAQQE